MNEHKDTGLHYRKVLRVKLSQDDKDLGYIDVNLDPFRIADVYNLGLKEGTLLKKILVCGGRGHNSSIDDLEDIICGAQRMIQMLKESE